MIQSALSSMSSEAFFFPTSEEAAYRAWIQRRETARKQIGRLSRRELQVVQLVCDGKANKTIAHELNVCVKTIEKHRSNATQKLGVGTTAEMIRIAILADRDVPEGTQDASQPYLSSLPVARRDHGTASSTGELTMRTNS